ncbi:hypothetical protein Afil01_43750 [Actinorhabdospora filicis]|uniref:Uncharacterized protein n=1 Tax=Actinorhabdospora filicis TaxID=1785913 RepID=A0A9W6WB03_9ACTN|nr:hypothetical protein [Actinorhabdospora filicis]GLZ79568.1 hypothetical protein Afil01_43750 [Actinorhabdospora filicis]
MRFADDVAAPESDDWADWLAYADALTAAGDPRGAAIHAEHRGEPDYAEAERELGLDGPRAEGSWRFTWSRGFIDRAAFRLSAEGTARRRELVTDAGDRADPERWEAALVELLLTHPAAARLAALELRLTDYHHSAARAARALARRSWPRLTSLSLGHDYEILFALHETSTGNRINPEKYLHDPVIPAEAGAALWLALPALRIELEGAFLLDDLDHETLTGLRTRGSVFADGSLFAFSTPALTSLEVEIDHDVHGTLATNVQLEELSPQRFPALSRLDLSRAFFEPEEGADLVVLAAHPILPRLRNLAIRDLVIEDVPEPLELLAGLAPRFAHLDLRIAGDIAIAGAADGEAERVLAAHGLGWHGDDEASRP